MAGVIDHLTPAADPSGLANMQVFDAQETADREEAAQALSEDHLVEYLSACYEESKTAHAEIRTEWDALWRMSKNEMDFGEKEEWQAQMALDKPHATVQSAKAVIRKALVDQPKYWTCEPRNQSEQNRVRCQIADKMFTYWLGQDKLNFPVQFADASEMGFRIGTSKYLKAVVRRGPPYRIELHGVEPWKIFGDPDALPRDPYSGLYKIHQDYVDWHVLKQGEQEGRYWGVERCRGQEAGDTAGVSGLGDADKRAVAMRKDLVVTRHKFRKAYLTLEFWGTLLDSRGDLLLPDATYTVCGKHVIRGPHPNPIPRVRWPMVAFSPMPDILRWDGRGLLNGVRVLWHLMNNLFMLHADNLNWTLNPAMEVFLDGLVDPTDGARYPGKWFYTRTREQVFRQIAEKSTTTEALTNLDGIFKLWQEFTFVSEFTAALPQSDKQDRTAREVEIKTQLGSRIFESIGQDCELGIVWFMQMLYDLLLATWDMAASPNVADIFGPEILPLLAFAGITGPEERDKMLRMDGAIRVSGISGLLSKADQLQRVNTILSLLIHPLLGMAFKPYEVAKVITEATDMQDKGVLKTEQEYIQSLQAQQGLRPQQEVSGATQRSPVSSDENQNRQEGPAGLPG